MGTIWKHKWIVLPIAVAIILAAGAVGAVALANPGGADPAPAAQQAATTAAVAIGDVTTTTLASDEAALDDTQLVSALAGGKAKLQQRLEQLKKRWAAARAKMSPDDQAAFDQLLEKAKDQRQALKEARKNLMETLKQMRSLVQKYKPASTTSTTATS
jgi:hypothetical protein